MLGEKQLLKKRGITPRLKNFRIIVEFYVEVLKKFLDVCTIKITEVIILQNIKRVCLTEGIMIS